LCNGCNTDRRHACKLCEIGSAAADQPAKTVDVKTIDMPNWKLDPATGRSVKKMIGKKVKITKGEEVGEIDNIVFDADGKVRQLIVTTFGFLGSAKESCR
jgi:hypothetical protein